MYILVKALWITLLSSLLFSTSVYADDNTHEFEWKKTRIIKGSEPESLLRIAHRNSKEYKESLMRDKAVAAEERRQMTENGYIITTDAMVSAHGWLLSSPDIEPVDEVQSRLAFEPAAFRLGLDVYGVIAGEPKSDGKVHEITSLAHHPVLGEITIRERSLATEPSKSDKYIYGPKFDMTVNGNPALLTVYRNKEQGRTAFTILSAEMLTTLSVGEAVLNGDTMYTELMVLAHLF